MVFFVGVIVVLYLLSWGRRGCELAPMTREKSFALRGVLAILIVLHHLSLAGVSGLDIFRSWGAPVVSLFFFLSGYGLFKSYQQKGERYLSGFLRHRMLEAVGCPFLLSWGLYRLVNWGHVPGLWEEWQGLLWEGRVVLPNSWFVLAILVFYVFFYLTYRCVASRFRLWALLFLCMGYVGWCLCMGYDRCWYISALAFPTGAWMARYESRLHALWTAKGMYYGTVPLCLMLMALCVYTHNEGAYVLVYLLIPLAFLCLFSRVQVERLGTNWGMSWLSRHAYEIYLTQGLLIELLRREYVYISSDLVYVVLCLAGTMGVAAVVRWLSRKIVGLGL